MPNGLLASRVGSARSWAWRAYQYVTLDYGMRPILRSPKRRVGPARSGPEGRHLRAGARTPRRATADRLVDLRQYVERGASRVAERVWPSILAPLEAGEALVEVRDAPSASRQVE